MSATPRTIRVQAPGSAANLGLWFDGAGLAYTQPRIELRMIECKEAGVKLLPYLGKSGVPDGRIRGTAGVVALETLLAETGQQTLGFQLQYAEVDDFGYPSGGTGSSGAEAAAVIVAANELLGLNLTQEQMVIYAGNGEAGHHLDNVAPSVFGGIVFITKHGDDYSFERCDPPANLRLLLGISSHQKVGGTEAARKAIAAPLAETVQAAQTDRANRAKQALTAGDVKTFLQLVDTDEFHEPRRADVGTYGSFNAADLRAFRSLLQADYGTALTVSGAGPSLLFWYDQRHNNAVLESGSINPEFRSFIDSWFADHGNMTMKLQPIGIDPRGAHSISDS